MAGIRGTIGFTLDLTFTGAGDLGDPKQRTLVEEVLSLTPGTAATDEANVYFSDTRTLAASANEDLDLTGTLTNAFGATVAQAEIVAIFLRAAVGNTNNITISRPASNGFVGPFLAAGDGLSVKPGEWLTLVSQSGWTVTAGTGDLVNIANSSSGTPVTYDVVIVGRSVSA